MLLDALRRLGAVILGDDVPAGAPSGVARPVTDGAEVSGRRRPRLDDVLALSPGIVEELRHRARTSGVVMVGVAALIVPAWSLVDRALEPSLAGLFLAVRLLCDLPILAALVVMLATPIGRRRSEACTFAAFAVVQIEVAWFIPRVGHADVYLMGFTLAIVASGCLLISRPRWTGALVAVSFVALAVCTATGPASPTAADLVGMSAYLATACLIGIVAHLRRHVLDVRELMTRVRLEREQERGRVLLARLERLSHEDPLTGLANRRRWDAEVVSACAAARTDGGVVSLLLLDLDHFKQINDVHGHPGGDEVLRRVGGLLASAVRGDDLVARLGGDEFAVLLPGATQARAVALAEELRCAAAGLRIEGFGPGEVSLSVGVAEAIGTDAYPLELLARADEQLYRAKTTRNAVGARAPAR